ncbi:MAG: flagellar basal body P-ring formation protein FlgA [Burkholderiales bacterium]|nr:MAG: flagellar basal body P-ring formation protein FlgA [Burkholderiales bacterium]
MFKTTCPLTALATLLLGTGALAANPQTAAEAPRQDLAAVQRVAQAYLQAETARLPGSVSATVGTLDPRLALPPCDRLEAYLPAGARLWGSSSVGVRCLHDGGLAVSLPVMVKVVGPVVIAARPLMPGQTLAAEDLATRQAELTQLPAGLLGDAATLVGKSLAVGVAAQQPLRQEWVRAPQAVKQGQAVKLVAQGRGFRLTNEGVAVSSALEGQVAQVRLASGQTVRGVARSAGVVEVVF